MHLTQEASGFLSEEQVQCLVNRLNTSSEDALAADWELIVLSALSYVGTVQHEPDLGGTRKVNFRQKELFQRSKKLARSGILAAARLESSLQTLQLLLQLLKFL